MTTQYKGRVEPHKSIRTLLQPGTNSQNAFEAFEWYWKYGFDREVGRDTYLSDPEEAKKTAIGRIHLRPVSFTGKEKEEFGYTATEECWDKWEELAEVPAMDSASKDIPTSNDWVVYCVDDERNACMLAYLPSSLDPHTFCRQPENMNNFIARANNWFGDNNSLPMPAEEFPHIFDDKWLEPES